MGQQPPTHEAGDHWQGQAMGQLGDLIFQTETTHLNTGHQNRCLGLAQAPQNA